MHCTHSYYKWSHTVGWFHLTQPPCQDDEMPLPILSMMSPGIRAAASGDHHCAQACHDGGHDGGHVMALHTMPLLAAQARVCIAFKTRKPSRLCQRTICHVGMPSSQGGAQVAPSRAASRAAIVWFRWEQPLPLPTALPVIYPPQDTGQDPPCWPPCCRNDLRTADHAALHAAVSSRPAALLPLYCLESRELQPRSLPQESAEEELLCDGAGSGLGTPRLGPFRLRWAVCPVLLRHSHKEG